MKIERTIDRTSDQSRHFPLHRGFFFVQLSIIPNNMVEEQYKSRTLVNYTQALRGLIEVQKTYKEDIENGKI